MDKPNLTDVYEALREAEKEGRDKDVEKLVSYIQSVESTRAETYDPKDLVSSLSYSLAGAGAGAVGSEVAKRAISKVEKGRALPATPTASVTVEGVPMNTLADIEEATTKGLSPEITQQTRTAQRAQRTEKAAETLARLKAQGVPVDPKILAEMENLYARQGSGLLIPVGEAKNIAMQEAAAATKSAPKSPLYKSAWEAFKSPSFSSTDAANFLKGIVDYRIPFTKIHTGPLLGHGLVGAGTGLQIADAINRETMGDTTGAIISGIGAAGTAASALPWMPAKVAGAGIGLSAEAINAYRDAMARGQIEHGAPQTYENTDPMGGQYAAGGLVYLAEGGSAESEEARRQLREWLEKNKPTAPRTYEERLRDMGRDPSIPGSPIVKNTPQAKGASGGAGFAPSTMNPFNPDSPLNR
jgi:hypothetical protein